MRRLCSLLGMPQNRFASIHVVGTNGKTSVARMIAALLEAQGVSAGAYVSPHIRSWRERILIRGEPISEGAFDSVVERAEQAAQVADRSAGDEGPVTQFELLTAAAFVAFSDARVQFAAIEAGLGGRLDATNVIPSNLTVLTSVGLDHTEYLGETLEEIAAEKLAVLRDHTTLIRGELPSEVEPVVKREAERFHAKAMWATNVASNLVPGYQARNLALARAASEQVLARADPKAAAGELPERFEESVLLDLIGGHALSVPGRAELVPGDPPMLFDAAHNPDGARALAELLSELAQAREPEARPPGLRRLLEPFRAIGHKKLQRRGLAKTPEVVCCLAVLEEKDAAGIVDALAPAIESFVCTEVPQEAIEGSGRPGGRSYPASELAEICRQAGVEAESIADPIEAWQRARELARSRDGVALAAGSHYLLSSIWTERHAASS
jgi:dihydrofolate synthase / folylpolyglutamate synthase